MTSQPTAPAADDRSSLPPDPAKFRRVPQRRGAQARAGEQPYIAGGEDPDLRRDARGGSGRTCGCSLAMVVFLVLLGFVLGIIGAIVAAQAG